MAELWEILGYDCVALKIAQGLGESASIRVVQGPPGVGKSWLARGIGALWESAGGRVVVAEGDVTRSNVSLSPFGISMDDDKSSKSLFTSIAALARIGELLIGTGGVLTSSIEALAKLQGTRPQKRNEMLDQQEQDVLFKLAKLGRKRPLLLIADNLHWWDARSLEFLSRLRDSRITEAFPFLREMRVLAVETMEPYQTVTHPRPHRDLLLPQFTQKFKLDGIPRQGFEDVLVSLGAPQRPSAEHTDLIYKFSGGHLVLAHRCAVRLGEDDAQGFLTAETPDEFVRDLISERVRKMGPGGEEALTILQVAAVSGLTFRRDALVCAIGSDEIEMSRLLRHCGKEDVLEVRNGTGRFVHDFYRQHFLNTLGDNRIAIHEMLGECMRKLDPGDYEGRCINALAAERLDEAAALAVQAALQRQRDGVSWKALPTPVLDVMDDGGLTPVAEEFQVAFEHLQRYRAVQCLSALARLPHYLPTPLSAESDYLRATCLMITRSERDRRDAQVLLESWSSYIEEEPEIGLRLMRLRLYHLALQVEKEPALRLENEIRRILRERQSFDSSAVDALYTLDRLAGSTQRPDRALDMIHRAVEYFGPAEEQSVLRRPVEYYLSLINLEATLVGRGRYKQALDVYRKIESLIDSYESGAFPRIDYPRTNAVLAEYRMGTVTTAEAAGRQRQIVVSCNIPDDPFFVENALAVYLTLDGSYEEALGIFDRVAAQLEDRGDPEPSLVYLIRANQCAARFLYGVESAKEEWADLVEVIEQIPYDTRREMLRRHHLLAKAISENTAISPLAFDREILDGNGFDPELSHAFWLPAIEWWR